MDPTCDRPFDTARMWGNDAAWIGSISPEQAHDCPALQGFVDRLAPLAEAQRLASLERLAGMGYVALLAACLSRFPQPDHHALFSRAVYTLRAQTPSRTTLQNAWAATEAFGCGATWFTRKPGHTPQAPAPEAAWIWLGKTVAKDPHRVLDLTPDRFALCRAWDEAPLERRSRAQAAAILELYKALWAIGRPVSNTNSHDGVADHEGDGARMVASTALACPHHMLFALLAGWDHGFVARQGRWRGWLPTHVPGFVLDAPGGHKKLSLLHRIASLDGETRSLHARACFHLGDVCSRPQAPPAALLFSVSDCVRDVFCF